MGIQTEQWRKTLMTLRDDALARGYPDLAIVYGWSAIRVGFELIEARTVSALIEQHQPTPTANKTRA
jgi:hypothetical protein